MLDAFHAIPLFLGLLSLTFCLCLTGVDTAEHEIAGFPKTGNDGLALTAALLTVDKSINRVYVFVPGIDQIGGYLVNDGAIFLR